MSNQDKYVSAADALRLLRGWHSCRAILAFKSVGPKGGTTADCFIPKLSNSGIEFADALSEGAFCRIVSFSEAIDYSVFVPSESSADEPSELLIFKSGLRIKMITGEQIVLLEYRKHSSWDK